MNLDRAISHSIRATTRANQPQHDALNYLISIVEDLSTHDRASVTEYAERLLSAAQIRKHTSRHD